MSSWTSSPPSSRIDGIHEAFEDETIENVLQDLGMIKEGEEVVMDGKIGPLFRQDVEM